MVEGTEVGEWAEEAQAFLPGRQDRTATADAAARIGAGAGRPRQRDGRR